MRVLVTRPEPDNERTASSLRARGHDVLMAALMRVETIPAAIEIGPFAAILMTSANAARAIAGHPRFEEFAGCPVWAVGERSAQAARAAGFRDVTADGGDAGDLVRLAASRGAALAPLLYLAGEDRTGDVAGELAAHGFAVKTAVIYRAVAADFPPALTDALTRGSLDAAMHFSRRSAQLFLIGAGKTGVRDAALALKHCCLSRQVAEPIMKAGAIAVAVASRPDEDAIMALLDS